MTKEALKKRLKEVGLSKKRFAKECNMPYNTVLGWTKSDKNNVPGWVKSWLENYQAKIELKKLRALVDKKA